MGNSTLIQQYATSVMRAMKDQADAVARLEHKPSKGRFREIFVQTVLAQFLTHQFGVGSGIIVNQQGAQSTEHDVIIFDRRILPPFIASGVLGVYPVEAVIATVEVKSELTNAAIQQADAASAKLLDIHRNGSIYGDFRKMPPPLASIIGFQANSIACDPKRRDESLGFLNQYASLFAICLVGRFSWLRTESWTPKDGYDDFEETKRFVAALLDNIRTKAERRYRLLTEKHRDWLTVYTRWDCSGAVTLRAATTTVSETTSEFE